MYFLLMFKLSFHLVKGGGGGGGTNMFVVKVPNQNFKQRSGRRGSLDVQAAFKSRCLFFFFPSSSSLPPAPPPSSL